MTQGVESELIILGGGLYAGLATGLLRDVLRLLRVWTDDRAVEAVSDAILLIGAGVLFAGALLITADGRLRLYPLIADAVGILIYAKSAGKLTDMLISGIKSLLKRQKASL